MNTSSGNQCALCSSPINHSLIQSHLLSFCCSGCQAVHEILSAQSALKGFKEHPVFKQALQAGLIANPDLIANSTASTEQEENEKVKIYFEVRGMWCPSCATVISLILLREKGVYACTVDYATDLATAEFSPRLMTTEKIEQLLKKLGYEFVSLKDHRQASVSNTLAIRFIVASFFSLNVMMFAYPIYAGYFDADLSEYSHLFGWLSFFGSIPVLSYAAWPIWKKCFSSLRVGIWGMESLVLTGVLAATSLSLYELIQGNLLIYFDSMTVIIVFVLLGKIIESKAKISAKDSLIRLTRALPKKGRKKMLDGSEVFVPLKEVLVGDSLIVLTGEKITLDGVVIAGKGACDESVMTGESVLTLKEIGSTVLAGTILQQGHLTVKVTSNLDETALKQIIDMVELDLSDKSRLVRAADVIVKWFVPFVFCFAFTAGFFAFWAGALDDGHSELQTAIIRAISVLLISCPCAIGIAAPLAESYLLNEIAQLGAIIRNRACLAYLGNETIFVCDKTGTMTEGKFSVLRGLENVSDVDLSALKGMVARSIHPVAVGINHFLMHQPIEFDHLEEVVGRGIIAKKGEESYLLGSSFFLNSNGLETGSEPRLTQEIVTTVYFAKGRSLIAKINLGDRLRKEAGLLIKSFTIPTYLVSGDEASSVQNIGQLCQFTQVYPGYYPLQKRELIQSLRNKGEVVMMVGDGVNDAPALTAAHVGIAVLSASDISAQVSDILLTTKQLNVIPLLRELGRKGRRIVKQNLFWAFFYNVIGMGLAFGGFLTPLFAAFAMIASSLIVLVNARRLKTN